MQTSTTQVLGRSGCVWHMWELASQFLIWSAFPLSASTPFVDIWWPRNCISEQNNLDFFEFKYSLWSSSACRIVETLSVCSFTVQDQIAMSSMYM